MSAEENRLHDPITATVVENIRRLRKRAGLTQEGFVDLCNQIADKYVPPIQLGRDGPLHRGVLAKWESGQTANIPARFLGVAALAFGVDPGVLFAPSDAPPEAAPPDDDHSTAPEAFSDSAPTAGVEREFTLEERVVRLERTVGDLMLQLPYQALPASPTE